MKSHDLKNKDKNKGENKGDKKPNQKREKMIKH
jgi:hypothetical protein